MELLFFMAIYAVALLLSWLVTVCIVKLVTLCFGWTFSWAVATGIWLVLMLARWVVSAAKNTSSKG